jgi:cyanophycin synthetase
VPVPEGEIVDSPAAAWRAAEDFGGPVVVKPTDGNHGRGVTLDLTRREDIEAAYEVAARHGSEVMVERFIPGEEHRLLVVGGRVVAAARGETAWVTGDGQHCVADLVDQQINTDPRRGTTEDHPLNRLNVREDGVILLDLQRQGLTPDSVPPAGKRVLVQRNGNVAIDCTDDVHPEVDHYVSLAAQAVGLDIAGIDVVAEDISRPLHEQGGAVVEVNAGPGLLSHLKPAVGKPRPVGQAIVEQLFPSDDADPHPGRIPIVGVAGTRNTHVVARAVAWLVHLSGRQTALACRDGLFVGQRRTEPAVARSAAYWEASHRLLMNRDAQAAVFENGPALILDEGLPYDRCHVGVVTDFDGVEDLQRHDIHEPDQLYKVLRTQIDVVLDDGVGVLNAADPRIVELADLCDGEVMFYAVEGPDRDPALVHDHCLEGGRAVVLRGGQVQLLTGASEQPGPDLHGVLQRHGHGGPAEIGPLAEALLAAVAAAWAFGISPELITAGIETFDLGPVRA